MKTLLRGIQLNGTELLISYFILILPLLDFFPDQNVNTIFKPHFQNNIFVYRFLKGAMLEGRILELSIAPQLFSSMRK